MSDGSTEVPGEPKLDASSDLPGEEAAAGGASLQQTTPVAQPAAGAEPERATPSAVETQAQAREVPSAGASGPSNDEGNASSEPAPVSGNVARESAASDRKRTVSEDEPGEDFESDDSEVDETGEVLPHVVEPEQDDPLGEAYDLELGSKLSRGPDPAEPWRSDVQTAKEFFNTEILYRYDILTDDEQKLIAGSYRIELRGQNGGVWTVNIGEQLEVVNRREDADIVMAMGQRDFLHLVNGSLNPQLAVLSQKMRITGDMRRGVAFQSILTPAGD